MQIPFNKPYMTGRELHYISQAHGFGHLSGDGTFTKKCQAWLNERVQSHDAFLTHSCTAALEMAALLTRIQPGDEVIMPSYTFVSTANAFALRGASIVFVDIRPDTLNLDETKIEAAITSRTKLILPVHYAGVGCEMDTITAIADEHSLWVIEDAAQGIMSSYKGRALGSIGDLAALSFHETKNIISGEGGALLINNEEFTERAEIIREKGTNRNQFFRGQVDKYTWHDIGSSYLPSDLIAAFLYAQMEEADAITNRRLAMWNRYHEALSDLEEAGYIRRPFIPDHCSHNAHMYYIIFPTLAKRTFFITTLKEVGIQTVFHYIPLHSSPAGVTLGRPHGAMEITNSISEQLVRLPLWLGLEDHLNDVIEQIRRAIINTAEI